MVHCFDKGHGTHLEVQVRYMQPERVRITHQAGKVISGLALQFLWTSKSLDIFDIGEEMFGVRSYDYEDKDRYK